MELIRLAPLGKPVAPTRRLKERETQHDPEARLAAKFYLVRRLYERGYTREKIINLFHFIDWVLQLP
jgi:hypothetical protein